jgi:hypothetical protein
LLRRNVLIFFNALRALLVVPPVCPLLILLEKAWDGLFSQYDVCGDGLFYCFFVEFLFRKISFDMV